MSVIHELSKAVHTRRTDMGLTQSTVARLSGLSRATVNSVEKGSIQDLSLKRAAKLLNVLGLHVTVECAGGKTPKAVPTSPFVIAARTASVTYRHVIEPEQLKQALASQRVPDEFGPHIRTLLEEASVALLASLVEQLHVETGNDRAQGWAHLRAMALELQSTRDLWI